MALNRSFQTSERRPGFSRPTSVNGGRRRLENIAAALALPAVGDFAVRVDQDWHGDGVLQRFVVVLLVLHDIAFFEVDAVVSQVLDGEIASAAVRRRVN